MGKKKKKNVIFLPNGCKKFSEESTIPIISKKRHNPTALELAFLEAQTKGKTDGLKRIDVSQPKAPPASASDSKKVKSIPPTVPQVSSSEIKPVATTSTRSTKKSVYIPPATKQPNKPNTIRQQPVKKQQNLPSIKHAGEIKRPYVDLGLKPVPDETISLNVSDYKYRNQKHDQKDNRKIEPKNGKSQVHDGSHNDESDIVIGFDFGTSSSKIVIRDSGRQTAYAVPFGQLACSGNIYLIPTIIFISNNGEVSLSEGDYSYGSLKVQLMDNPMRNIFTTTNTSQSVTASELAAAYMSLVIRFARDWFLKRTESIYKKTYIHWHINLGIPSKNYDDNNRIRKTFQTIAMASWRLSCLDTVITVTDVKKYLRKADNPISPEGKNINPGNPEALWLHPDFVNTHPEVIMEVVGYARSSLRTSGLHLLVDVGAATLDAATFIIHSREGEDVFPLLETKVERYGTMMLHNNRIQALKNKLQKILLEKNAVDPIKPLPNLMYYEIQAGKDDLSENDTCFFRECSTKIAETIRETKTCRDPYSRAWEKGLPVFICGGGGRLPSYREMITTLGERIANNLNDFTGFEIKEIPKPNQLEAPELPLKEYDRLAVAYGLSFTSAEIGEVIPESKICDIQKKDKVSSIEDRFVSKDMC